MKVKKLENRYGIWHHQKHFKWYGKKSQDLISQKFEEQNLKISKIMQEYKKLFMKNWELNSQINNLIEQQESQKKRTKTQTNQTRAVYRSSWMIEIASISNHKEKNCIQLISELAELAEIINFSKNQIDLAHRTSNKPTAPLIILFNKKSDQINF